MNASDTPRRCVIVANGRFPRTERPLRELAAASAVIACDGSVYHLEAADILPTAIVGDLDSLPVSLQERYADRIHPVRDQEINDLTKAVRFAREAGYTDVLILGATGLREDHTLGNISLLAEYAPSFRSIEILSDYGRFVPLLRSATLSCTPGQQISLFNLYPEGEITTEGLRWPITRRKLTAWWQGTLNEALGEAFTVTLSPGAKAIVYLCHPEHALAGT